MKRIYTAIVMSLATVGVFAQPKITYQANGLNVGDMRNMKEVEYKAQGEGGANKVWNFSGSKEIKSMNIAQNANVAVQIGNVDLSSRGTLLACDEGGEKTTYYEITGSEKKYWGLTNGSTKIEFNQPVVDLKFPMAYQDVVGGVLDGYYVSGNAVENISGNYFTEADAWGSLVLPDGKEYSNVLRVKLTKTYTQKYGSTNYNIKTVRYQYYAEGVRYPVLIALESVLDNDCNCACGHSTSEQMFYLPVDQSDMHQIINKQSLVQSDVRINVFPNPAIDEVTAQVNLEGIAEEKASVDVVDASGRLVKDFGSYNLIEGQNDIKLQVSDVVSGHYFVRVRVNGVSYAKSLFKTSN